MVVEGGEKLKNLKTGIPSFFTNSINASSIAMFS